jgi:hypothetical protein
VANSIPYCIGIAGMTSYPTDVQGCITGEASYSACSSASAGVSGPSPQARQVPLSRIRRVASGLSDFQSAPQLVHRNVGACASVPILHLNAGGARKLDGGAGGGAFLEVLTSGDLKAYRPREFQPGLGEGMPPTT